MEQKKVFHPAQVAFYKDKIGGSYYLRNEFDLTENPEILSFNKHVFFQRVISLVISTFWFYILIFSALIDLALVPSRQFNTVPDIFGAIEFYVGVLVLAIFNLDKSVKIWGGIGNFWLKFTAVITAYNAFKVIMGFIFFQNYLQITSYPITFTFTLLVMFGSIFAYRTAKVFSTKFSNNMLVTEAGVENYQKTASYRVPIIILVSLCLIFIFNPLVMLIIDLIGYQPIGGIESQLYNVLLFERVAVIEVSGLGIIVLLIALLLSIVFSYHDVYKKAEHTAIKRGAFYESTEKRILICGAGAIGGIMGAYLTLAGEKVILYDSNVDHVKEMNKNGLHITGMRGNIRVKVSAASNFQELNEVYKQVFKREGETEFDIVILAVKSAYTEMALKPLLSYMNKDTMVITVQNSINDDLIGEIVGRERFVHGITFWGGTNIGPGKLEQTSIGHFQIGEILDKKDTDRIQTLKKVMGNFGRTKVSDNIIVDAWNKLIFNGVMNTYGLIFGERCFVLFNNPDVLPIVLATISEEAKIARRIVGSLGKLTVIQMDDFDMDLDSELKLIQYNAQVLKIVSSNSGRIKSSMLQDYERGVKSENDYLLGLFIEKNKSHSEKTPTEPISIPFIKRAYEIAEKIDNKEISPSIDNIKYFKDLFETYPDYWKQRENFKLDSFKNKFFIKFFTAMANIILGNY